jgi:transcriptional regulator with XRE-family HTH domain
MTNDTACLALGAIIRARRIELGYTQESVAKAAGWVAAEMVSMIETGRRSPNLDKIPRIARKLDLDAADLCRVALAESYPILYQTIFPTTVAPLCIPQNPIGTPEIGQLEPIQNDATVAGFDVENCSV